MKLKIELNKEDMKQLSLISLVSIIKFFNKRTEAYFKRCGDERLEIIIERR